MKILVVVQPGIHNSSNECYNVEAVMECYFLSRPVEEERKLVRGYRRRMHHIWKEQYATEITEQRLRD